MRYDAFWPKRLSFTVLMVVAILVCGGRAQAQSSNFYRPVPMAGDFLQNLTYGNDPAEILDVCRPADTARLHPGLIMIHGGRWIEGDKAGLLDTWCQELARRGYVVTDIDYRLDNVKTPRSDWPAFQIGDVQLAIRWMRYHAHALALDPARLCGYGESAGAYLTVYAGTRRTIYPSDVDWIAPTVPVDLSCIVDAFGPVDLTTAAYQPKIIQELIGVSYQQNPGLYHDDSPVFHVSHYTPPTLMIHGTQDTTVPIAQSQELLATLRRDGVSDRLVTYNGSHAYHGLDAAGLAHVLLQISRFLANQIGAKGAIIPG